MGSLCTTLLMIISIWGYSQTEVRINVATSENETATGTPIGLTGNNITKRV